MATMFNPYKDTNLKMTLVEDAAMHNTSHARSKSAMGGSGAEDPLPGKQKGKDQQISTKDSGQDKVIDFDK